MFMRSMRDLVMRIVVDRPTHCFGRCVAFSTLTILFAAIWVKAVADEQAQPAANQYDVVVYGGTSAGVVAAVQAASQDKKVVLVEPSNHLGGLSSGGLGATDIGNKSAIGGLAREFYRRIRKHYLAPAAWSRQTLGQYVELQQGRANDDAMWTFEPHVAEKVFDGWVREYDIVVLRKQRLARSEPVAKQDARLTSLPLESGQVLFGKEFIDATYEGDLMAWAGVSYAVGRESNDKYGETLNGVQTERASSERYVQRTHPFYHQFAMPLDPFVIPGDPASGLLWGIQDWQPPSDGTGDEGVQAYCFRMCQTDVPENRRPWNKPTDYDQATYELLLRYFDAGEDRLPLHMVPMPNRKTDTNNNGAFSTDNIGNNYSWPEADYQARDKLFREHLNYQQGLMWTLAHHPRVPAAIREAVQQWGLAKDEFVDNEGWPHQLYIREGRHMISDYVMMQLDCQGERAAFDSVGLGAYQLDSHHVHRYFDGSYVRNEGMFQVGGLQPYPISWRAIIPRREECTNLIVPVCLSASHVAYGSIRMEPVFMVLGQSAGCAAALACEAGISVQDLDYATLRRRLLADGQILSWAASGQ